MTRVLLHVLTLLLALSLTACGGGSGGSASNDSSGSGSSPVSTTQGSANFQIDLATLGKGGSTATAVAATTTITAVSVTLTRSGYTDINQSLTVANNVASGTVDGLAPGYWHVHALVYSGSTLIYTGDVDVNISAGVVANCQINFDPVSVAPVTGSVAINVGLNPVPTYKQLNQYVTSVMFDNVAQKFYVPDATNSLVAVYNGDTLVREKDVTLPNVPAAYAVDQAGGTMLLGYPSGKIFRLDMSTGTATQVADAQVAISALVPFGGHYVFVANASVWGPQNTYKTMDLSTGLSVSSQSYWYPLSGFANNDSKGQIYGLDSGLSPADMHHITVNSSTGAITLMSDSRYHGDYAFGGPVRIINNGSRVITASGNIFTSTNDSSDITYAGNLGTVYVDLANDDTRGNLYVLTSGSPAQLKVVTQSTLFTQQSVTVPATPSLVFNTTNKIVVFVTYSGQYYAKAIAKSDLGL